jgi:catechol 2,3-dioxygenase-like lactoylglutathione lyase family enzyme
MKLAAVSYLVRDYDEAIHWFVEVLGFSVLEDTRLSDTKRWVRVEASNGGACLLLARADTDQQVAGIGQAAGGRVAYFLQTDDFQSSYQNMMQKGVRFRESPRREVYGHVAVFEDLYGNLWDLIEPAAQDQQ